MASTSDPAVERQVEAKRVRLERLLQIASREFDLRLDFSDKDRIGSGQIVVGVIPAQAAHAEHHILLGHCLHLLGHYLARSLDWADAVRLEEERGKPFLSALWHALEDARLENGLIRRWPGARRSLDSRIPPNLGGSLVALMDSTHQVEMGLYLYGREKSEAQFGDEVRQALEAARVVIHAGANGDSPRASLDAAMKVYPLVAHLLRASHVGFSRPPMESKERDHLSDQLENKAAPDWEESGEIGAIGVMGRQREFPDWYQPGSAPWFERGLGGKEIHPTALQPDRQTITAPPTGDKERYRQLLVEIQQEAGYLTRRLTNLLEEQAYLRFGGYHRSGKLNMAKLWKQRLGGHRLFQRPLSGSDRGVAFSILVDESASMGASDKIPLATKLSILLGETLGRLDIPFEIIGFTTAEFEARAAMQLGLLPAHEHRTTRCSALQHRLYKRYDEPFRHVRARITGLQARHNNWDEEHLLFGFRRLQARSERRKVMIIISDGQPNGDADHLQAEVGRISQLGVHMIGIGIGSDFVRQIYPESLVVTEFQTAVEDLFAILSRQVQRRENVTRAYQAENLRAA